MKIAAFYPNYHAGAGHVMRDIALAEALRDLGFAISFRSAGASPAWAQQEILDRGFHRSLKCGGPCSVAIYDDYNLSSLVALNALHVVLDDTGSVPHLGEQYRPDLFANALIRQEFVGARHEPAEPRTYLVMLGGVQSYHTGLVINDLLKRGAGAVFAPVLGGMTLLKHRTISSLMRDATAAVVSTSTTCLEALCVGIPTVAVQTSNTQDKLVEWLKAKKAVKLVRAADAAAALMSGEAMTKPGVVDGLGAKRIAEEIAKRVG